MNAPVCRACGSARTALKGRKFGGFIRREFAFHACHDCGFLFVEPFSGFEIYNDAYYRGHGPDPYVDYESEYRDWRRSDRLREFDDMARIAEKRLREEGAKGPRDQRTKGLRDKETEGPKDEGTKGPRDQKTKRLGDQEPTVRPHLPSTSLPLSVSPSLPLSLSPSPPLSVPAPPLRWLDFGCGAGAFLKYLRERGALGGRPLELTGHDVGSYATLLERTDGFRILDLAALTREPAASFDVISLIEVLEHLPAPREPLQLVARLLKPGGLLLLTTGNLDSPVARRQGLHYRYCAPEIHVSLFNPRCLAHLYRSVGLVPYPVRYHGAVQFKVLKSLRHRRPARALAAAALRLPPFVRLIDRLYGVSAMPCAIKPPV